MDALDALRTAIAKSGIPQKAVAIELGISEGQCSRQLNAGGFPLADLDKLPKSIVQQFLSLYAASLGMRVERQDEQARAIAAALEAMGRAIEAIGLKKIA